MIAGKRYEWSIYVPSDGRIKSGLFTGKYDEKTGNAILMTKNGETWSVPVKELKRSK